MKMTNLNKTNFALVLMLLSYMAVFMAVFFIASQVFAQPIQIDRGSIQLTITPPANAQTANLIGYRIQFCEGDKLWFQVDISNNIWEYDYAYTEHVGKIITLKVWSIGSYVDNNGLVKETKDDEFASIEVELLPNPNLSPPIALDVQ